MSKQLISIHVDESELGIKWTLNILGRVVNSGYALDQWQALDAANEELAKQFFSPLGRYYQARKDNEG
jgi:hypothetical protein